MSLALKHGTSLVALAMEKEREIVVPRLRGQEMQMPANLMELKGLLHASLRSMAWSCRLRRRRCTVHAAIPRQ